MKYSPLEEIGLNNLLAAFNDLLSYAERNTCLHEETRRGGAIWTICDSCGKKWSDDKNPLSAEDHEFPLEIQNAQEILAKFEKID